MKKSSYIILLCFILSIAAGCNEQLSTIAKVSELEISPDNELVDDFLFLNKNYISAYEADECYNITPDFITDNSDYNIFKYKSSAVSFLLFDNKIYELGTGFGGYGLTSVALADSNNDNQYELYFTFSWGSGMHRSQVGYFDPVINEVVIFDYSYYDYDMMLTTNENNDLLVNEAEINMDNLFVDFSIKATKQIGSITFENNSISLDISDALLPSPDPIPVYFDDPNVDLYPQLIHSTKEWLSKGYLDYPFEQNDFSQSV